MTIPPRATTALWSRTPKPRNGWRSLSFFLVCAGKHGDGHKGSSHAMPFSATLTKKKRKQLLGYQPGMCDRSPSTTAKPTVATRTSSAMAEMQTHLHVQLRGWQRSVRRQEQEVRGWGRVRVFWRGTAPSHEGDV